MAIQIRFDPNHNAVEPTLVLATKYGAKLGVINTAENISLKDAFSTKSEMSFDVRRELDGVRFPLWNQLVDFKLVWCKEWDKWFEAKVTVDDSDGVVKSVTCTSLGEAELGQIKIYDVEINTEADIEREDYVAPTVLYDAENAATQLLDRIMEKAPHYRVKYVDPRIASIQRTFTFSDTSIYDAMQDIAEEIGCLFVFDSGQTETGRIDRTIAVYDLESYCQECGYRGEFSGSCPECGSDNVLYGYGEDTNIFVSSDNLGDGINFETDTGAVKNCFRLCAGDDLMTATIANCNPNGSSYLWYISDGVKSDMPEELVARLEEYDAEYKYYQNEHEMDLGDIAADYSALLTKYADMYDGGSVGASIVGYPALMEAQYGVIDLYYFLKSELMPSMELSGTSAADQCELLTAENLSPVQVSDVSVISLATADNAVLGMAKCVVDARYEIKVNTSSLESQVWTGSFIVTSYSDEENTAVSSTVSVVIDDDYEGYVKQMLEKSLNKAPVDDTSIGGLFEKEYDDFCTALTQYSLDSLTGFNDACQSCMDILIDQGIADKSAYEGEDSDLYTQIYLPYYNKKKAIEAEMRVRSDEIDTVNAVADRLDNIRWEIQAALNFQTYLGDELWTVFSAYRREDTYQNDNYISDGLTNAELFSNALQFIEAAQKEIYKSAELQHSITSTLRNLLVMREFRGLCDKFAVGNWIRVRVDREVYRLRLLSYQLDFSNLSALQVEFSDVTMVGNSMNDVKNVLEAAAQMATSYGAVARQAEHGDSARTQISDWYSNSMALTNMSIVSGADNQNMTIDSHGVLMRAYEPITDTYSDEQLKLINRGLYITDDGWLTSRAGIGKFKFYNPETGQIEYRFGVIADTIVGSVVLSEKVGVYTENGNIKMDANGLQITSNADEGESESLFVVRRQNDDGTYTDLLYVDSDGNLQINGSVSIVNSSSSSESVPTVGGLTSTIETRFLQTDSDTEAPTATWGAWSEDVPTRIDGKYIWLMQKITYANGSYKYTEAVCITGAKGEQGEKGDAGDTGADGKDGTKLLIEYALSDSATVPPPDDTYETANASVATIAVASDEGIAVASDTTLDTPEIYLYTSQTSAVLGEAILGLMVLGASGDEGQTQQLGTPSIYLYTDEEEKTQLDTPSISLVNSVWQTIPPTRGEGQYIWQRITYIYSDGTYLVGTPVCITGQASYLHIKYSDVAAPTDESQMTETPSAYIGIYTDAVETDSTDPAKYTWQQFRGDQGVQGVQGDQSYLHIAYANSADGTADFSVDDGDGKEYIGTYSDMKSADSTDPQDYTWVKIKGDQGVAGKDAITYRIESSKGAAFLSSQVTTTVLTARIYRGYVEVDTAGAYGYTWYVVDKDGVETAVGTGKSIQLSSQTIGGYGVYFVADDSGVEEEVTYLDAPVIKLVTVNGQLDKPVIELKEE